MAARVNQVIYENSRGVQTVLDGEIAPWREVMGRTGCGVPPVKYSETTYANGVTETTSVSMLSRDVSLFFWMEGFDKAERIAAFRALKLKLLEVGKKNTWGKLKFRCSDGTWVYLNCIYSGGLSSETEADARFQNFVLDFHSADPLFYSDSESEINLTPTAATALKMSFQFGVGVKMRGVRSSVYQHMINLNSFMAYPDIVIVGPASGIQFENVATGKKIYFKSTFALVSGETLTISTRPLYQKVEKTDTAAVVTDVTAQLAAGATLRWALVNGDNLIKVSITGMTEDTSCTLIYREGHLSLW